MRGWEAPRAPASRLVGGRPNDIRGVFGQERCIRGVPLQVTFRNNE